MRNNPREEDWLAPDEIEPWVALAKKWGVSEVALSSRGFWPAFKRAGGRFEKLGQDAYSGQNWRDRRNNFVSRHWAQIKAKGEPLWVDGLPTPRHLALIIWAFSPDPEKLAKAEGNIKKAGSSRPTLRRNAGYRPDKPAQPAQRLERQQQREERQIMPVPKPAAGARRRVELTLVPLRYGKEKGWRITGKVWDSVPTYDAKTQKTTDLVGIVGMIQSFDVWDETVRSVQRNVASQLKYKAEDVILTVQPEHEAIWLNKR